MSTHLTRSLFFLVALACAAFPATAVESSAQAAEEAATKKPPAFIRLEEDEKGRPTALQTAVVRYVPGDGKSARIVVDLVGAIHVGEKSYYEALNKSFANYDVVLYELVAPEGAVPRRGEKRGGGAIMGLQSGMKSLLGLQHQLEGIDYQAKNFVHADMSPKEFAQSMKNRDESMLGTFFRMLGGGIATSDPSGAAEVSLIAAMFSKNRELRLRRIMAGEFSRVGGRMSALEGSKGSTIITERNKKALEVLKREIAAGKKRIGIFYGAGHLADMEQRLIEDFGLKRASESWLTAWNLQQLEKSAPVEEGGDK